MKKLYIILLKNENIVPFFRYLQKVLKSIIWFKTFYSILLFS